MSKGLVRMDAREYPFRFTCLAGSPEWQVDIVEGKRKALEA